MRIWIDLANSPHVPFFRALIPLFRGRGHDVVVTARDFAQTLELAQRAGLDAQVVGGGGSRSLTRKGGRMAGRALALARWARGRGIDLAVGHNSYAQVAAARLLGIRGVTLMDYEHQPANHLAFRLASRVVVPASFPEEALRRFGARRAKVSRYEGTKEDVYLADFEPDPRFADELRALGVEEEDVLVVARPPARDALYHRFENELFAEAVEWLCARPRVRVLLLARTDAQREEYRARLRGECVVWPRAALDGANLVAAADLVLSAGGTMNREAAALGVPAATVYAGRWAAVDEQLVREGRLTRVATRGDVRALPTGKKAGANPRRASHVRDRVAEMILGVMSGG